MCFVREKREYELNRVEGHEGGRNLVYVCRYEGEPRYVARISATGDRREQDYLAEVEFVHYLAQAGANVADVLPSVNADSEVYFSPPWKQ